jgi:hypothetical protein
MNEQRNEDLVTYEAPSLRICVIEVESVIAGTPSGEVGYIDEYGGQTGSGSDVDGAGTGGTTIFD